MIQKLPKTFGLLLAASLFIIAIFTVRLGIDTGSYTKFERILTLGVGASLVMWVFWDFIQINLVKSSRPLFQGISQSSIGIRWKKVHGVWESLMQTRFFAAVRRRWLLLTTLLSAGFVIWLYAFVPTFGTFKWPDDQNLFYYQMLADGFAAGQLYLLEEPSSELLAIENPYYHENRGTVDFLFDAVLFEGKYYLYWGPAPSLLLLIIQPFLSQPISDTVLIYAFTLGTAIFAALLFQSIWAHFSWLPRKMTPSLIAVAINAPVLWLLHKQEVYEAVISSGQFFLMGGFYFAFNALSRREISTGRLILAGVFWALAANSRINLGATIFFLGLMVIGRIFITTKKERRSFLKPGIAFGLPLLLGAIGLLAYNQARFGSPFETGHKYQLTMDALPLDNSRTFSSEYIIPNAYSYLMRPPHFSTEFPYVKVPWIKKNAWPDYITIPQDYVFIEPVANIFLSIPILGLGALAFLRAGWLGIKKKNAGLDISEEEQSLFTWLLWALGGSILVSVSILFVFIYNTYRYVFDFSTTAILFSVLLLGLNQAQTQAKKDPIQTWLWLSSWRIAVALTSVFAFLIVLTGHVNKFELRNPDFYFMLKKWLP